jgi:hypothetical protein
MIVSAMQIITGGQAKKLQMNTQEIILEFSEMCGSVLVPSVECGQ